MVETECSVYVWTSRSQPRNQETGEISFDITFDLDTSKVEVRRVPITALMNLSDKTIAYEEITSAINDWISVAKHHPTVRRNCLCCFNRATKGTVLCAECDETYGPTIYAVNDDDDDEVRADTSDGGAVGDGGGVSASGGDVSHTFSVAKGLDILSAVASVERAEKAIKMARDAVEEEEHQNVMRGVAAWNAQQYREAERKESLQKSVARGGKWWDN